MSVRTLRLFHVGLVVLLTVILLSAAARAETTLLNVSYDPTRELYRDLNKAFVKHQAEPVTVKVSHAGSSKQARAVLDGLNADVVSLALAYDIDVLAEKGHLLSPDWQKRLPDNSAPYTSTIVFLVHKGNPKAIKDWGDLVKEGVQVITPNPKTSGGARWNYLAAWGWALRQNDNDQTKAQAYLRQLFQHVPVLDSGARGATTTFTEKGIGDVLLAWENEAFMSIKDASDKFELVVPSVSILAEPPVAVVDKNVDANGTRSVAEAYVKFLYTPEAQEIIAKNFYRPRSADVAKKYEAKFPKVALFTVDEVFGGWAKAQKTHFEDGGTFDQIQAK